MVNAPVALPAGYRFVGINFPSVVLRVPIWPGQHGSDIEKIDGLTQTIIENMIECNVKIALVMSIHGDAPKVFDGATLIPHEIRIARLDDQTKTLGVSLLSAQIVGDDQKDGKMTRIVVRNEDAPSVEQEFERILLTFVEPTSITKH